MIVTGRLGRLGEHADRGGVAADIGQRQADAEFHHMLSNKQTTAPREQGDRLNTAVAAGDLLPLVGEVFGRGLSRPFRGRADLN